MKYWCAANSNLAYSIELTTELECQKQLLMSSISNLGGRESLEIAVICRLDTSSQQDDGNKQTSLIIISDFAILLLLALAAVV